jgi:hypothetical protein
VAQSNSAQLARPSVLARAFRRRLSDLLAPIEHDQMMGKRFSLGDGVRHGIALLVAE